LSFKISSEKNFFVALTVIKFVPLIACNAAMDRYVSKVGVKKDDGTSLFMRAGTGNDAYAIHGRGVETQFPLAGVVRRAALRGDCLVIHALVG
jgi:hypothetical protein